MQTLNFDLSGHGERSGEAPLDVFNDMRDLKTAAAWAFAHNQHVSLFACSIGAYLALQRCAALPFERALFQSPIVDMPYLVGRMMEWASVTPERLAAEREIDTPVDTLRWDCYQYIRAHPVEAWPIPTAILYGGRDSLQPRAVLDAFSRRFGCRLTVSPDSEHPFLADGDAPIVEAWMREAV